MQDNNNNNNNNNNEGAARARELGRFCAEQWIDAAHGDEPEDLREPASVDYEWARDAIGRAFTSDEDAAFVSAFLSRYRELADELTT